MEFEGNQALGGLLFPMFTDSNLLSVFCLIFCSFSF